MLIRNPRTSPAIMIFAIAAAIVVAVLIVRLVFAFGWYASGLAADKAEEQKRKSEPIDVKFADPNGG